MFRVRIEATPAKEGIEVREIVAVEQDDRRLVRGNGNPRRALGDNTADYAGPSQHE
jgi:hypothetical protein